MTKDKKVNQDLHSNTKADKSTKIKASFDKAIKKNGEALKRLSN
ncbi:hypothetical protein QIX46_17965 [Lysinibacillus boronitolerans]|nr:hypothetical protein QIX46_17965 [Lysinibacillus boronitolerans]